MRTCYQSCMGPLMLIIAILWRVNRQLVRSNESDKSGKRLATYHHSLLEMSQTTCAALVSAPSWFLPASCIIPPGAPLLHFLFSHHSLLLYISFRHPHDLPSIPSPSLTPFLIFSSHTVLTSTVAYSLSSLSVAHLHFCGQ
jgi:hypothetical protein